MDDDILANYEQLFSGRVNDVIPIVKFRSSLTGIQVVIALVEGPVVSGYFCLATEAEDDDGLPHTLEHLIFMGSEAYPFKGVLDKIATRSLSTGTNAWTDTDHTCYTMTTAGSDGFINLLPVYLDHILYPLLTESAYLTEVHHINGEGEDAGVVYSEMQGRENTGESRTHLEMLRAMFPENSGYRFETGGILENIRNSTCHAKVKQFHESMYRPENLYLIVTGAIDPELLLKTLYQFECKIVSKGQRLPFVRPWQTPVPPLKESVVKTVPFASDEEEEGMVVVAWRGSLAKDQRLLAAHMILMEYLTDTAVSPLMRDFVEIEEPFCSEVNYSILENSETVIYLEFENVPIELLEEIHPKLSELLKKFATETEAFDMTRLLNIIHVQELDCISNIEDQPHTTISMSMIGDFVYGNTPEDVEFRLNKINLFRDLKNETQNFWVDLVKDYYFEKNTVTILGKPSIELMEVSGKAEEERLKDQQVKLGRDGLSAKSRALEMATEENEKPVPVEIVRSIPVPSIDSIFFHSLYPTSNAPYSLVDERFDVRKIPFLFYLDDIKTNFVIIHVVMNTCELSTEDRPYLPLFLEVILESAIKRNGVLVSHEEVIAELEADTQDISTSIGVNGGRFECGEFSSMAVLYLKVEVAKYRKAIQWIKDLLFNIKFSMDRLKIIASKMMSDVNQMKRDGHSVVSAVSTACCFEKESNFYISGMLRQQKFLKKLVKCLEKRNECEKFITIMKSIRDVLTSQGNIRIHMAANVEGLVQHLDGSDPAQEWITDGFFPPNHPEGNRSELKENFEFLKQENPMDTTSYIVGVGSVESSYLTQSTRCFTDFNHPDLPALIVYCQYLTQLEGPMWQHIRGLGLAYDYGVQPKLDHGLIYFTLYKSSQLTDAYEQAKDIVSGFLDGSMQFEPLELESAKSSFIFQLIESVETPSRASEQSFICSLRGLDQSYHREMMKALPLVTVEDLLRVGKEYVAPLFDPTKSKVAITCHLTKVKEIVSKFQKSFNRKLKIVDSLDAPLLADM